MATNMLTLPLELRELIYSELLSSKRSSSLELYNHSKGREKHFNLHPSILRTNKQIHAEAISYLYKDNVFNLDLDGPISRPNSRGCHMDNPHHKRPILPLFRNDDTLRTAVLVDDEYCDCRHMPIHRNCRCRLLPIPGHGPIYPHVLCRLAHIELCIGAISMWERSSWKTKDPRSLSATGKVVLEILRLLAEEEIEEVPVTRKTLKIDIRAKWVDDNLFLGDKGPSLSQEDGRVLKTKLLALLREIGKRRVVEVTEAVLNRAKGRNEIKEVDIGTGEAFPG